MKKNKNQFYFVHQTAIFITVCTLILSLRCSTNMVSGTSGSETGNGKVYGYIVDTTGKSCSGVQVALRPSTYDPLKSSTFVQLDTTDTSGKYFFTCTPGNYTIQSINHSEGTKTYSDNVIVDTNDIVLAPDTLKTPGTITITLPETGHLQDGYFYIPGTTIYSFPVENSNSAILDSVPVACITSICYTELGNDNVRVIRNNVKVVSNNSTNILHPEWEYTKHAYVNTKSGIHITKDVIDFPVLLRLSKQNFTFSQSDKNGSDLFFTNSSGTPLPFTIEHWDSTTGSAEIWVKVDTIHANSDSQYIVMLWGNSSPDPKSDEAVFDTANGYQGVWHLTENSLSDLNNVSDETSNGNNGKYIGDNFGTVMGAIGSAIKIGSSTSNKESYIELPNMTNLDYHGAITISCWIRFTEDSPDSFNIAGKYSFCENSISEECIISGYTLFCSSLRTIQLRIGFGDSLFFFLESDTRITDNNWHYIAAIFQPNKISLFIDDTEKQCALPEIPVPSSESGFIGGKFFFDGTELFAGEIDEFRISNTVRTSDWIRLNYLNQKPNDALIMWGNP